MLDPDTAPPCPDPFATTIANSVNRNCTSQGLPPGKPVLTLNSHSQQLCWTRCGAQAGVVTVETPDGARWTSQLCAGDLVLAAGPDLDWCPVPLAFSEGMSLARSDADFAVLRLGSHPADGLTILADQLFLLDDGRLTRAGDLTSGDSVRTADGEGCTVTDATAIVLPSGFAWSIATGIEPPRDLDGHLLSSHGLVMGDYALQLFFDALAAAGLARQPAGVA
ncbi:MAG: hypothetical protein U0S50_15075 [Sphingopyxis sp.]|uniref:hypothetical protein n=1 Tax=Sphingopyxis sp. TaxID=1908224 RepID=UPI002AB91C6B|nr:hypothetical protein [Sphingopyxis sp.]MDZ3833119.1 hypothetical protein [Sphingopyxis sp.]